MNLQLLLGAALDPANILRARGFRADAWQRALLRCQDPYILLNCCRQAGKSTVVAALALHEALFNPRADVLLLSPSQRQSAELFRKVMDGYQALDRPVKATHQSQLRLELVNGSRILSLPGREDTIRGFGPRLILIDEAARVPDHLYHAVRPMLAVSRGRLVALSTPFGQRGWFFEEWHGEGSWKRVEATWRECPRISAVFIQDEIRALGATWVDQEYNCLFTATQGLVYPDFPLAICKQPAVTSASTESMAGGQPVGGIDWGWRNPFAAVWGVLDADDVLWLHGERYLSATPLHEHAQALPRILWYCDPAGRTEMEEFRIAGHVIRQGINDIRLGIAAVTARLRTGRLKIDAARCPNLVAEARRYRYPSDSERIALGENPIDEHNHALGALRYLVSQLDARYIARLRQPHKPIAKKAPREDHPDMWTTWH